MNDQTMGETFVQYQEEELLCWLIPNDTDGLDDILIASEPNTAAASCSVAETPAPVQLLSSSVDFDDPLDDPMGVPLPPFTADNKKIKRREQNRKAAKNCREKKKLMADQSLQEYQSAMCTNTRLQYHLTQYKKELKMLKDTLQRINDNCPIKRF